jgi:hypothetical protein
MNWKDEQSFWVISRKLIQLYKNKYVGQQYLIELYMNMLVYSIDFALDRIA